MPDVPRKYSPEGTPLAPLSDWQHVPSVDHSADTPVLVRWWRHLRDVMPWPRRAHRLTH
ncbi:hypothetical protein ACFV2N_35620 [Streptomyces sp. NPDC059680]|uniref:hypothetical protein n=1 Tax=Streptomyces sp. NPDC059680 TaxID=3346904 RepID=UPI0036A72831